MTKHKAYSKLLRALQSQLFFSLTLVWFGLQALWLSLTALYPMAYDEEFHFKVMHLYADKFHPFWSSAPPGSSTYGAVARDPSYMYHYVMSFPLRLVEQFVHSEKYQVLFLRFCSIAFFVIGLWLFRKVLRRAGVSEALSNVVIFMVAATPLVPFLAAQINYDNLVFLLLPASLLYFQTILARLKKSHKLDVKSFAMWCLICMFTSLVKYAFLPILLAMGITLLIYYFKQGPKSWKLRYKGIQTDWKKLGLKTRIVLASLFIILFGLCFERYGVNIIRYHTPVPECDQVLTIDECLDFGPWRRNYYTRRSKLSGQLVPEKMNFRQFALRKWLSQTTYQLFYSLDGPRDGYQVARAYKVNRKASVIIFLAGVVLYVSQFRYLRRHYRLGVLLTLSLTYLLVLLLQNYADFLHLGYPFGIQGRYLIPTLPIIYAVVGVSFAAALRKLPKAKLALAIIAMVVIVSQAGGASTYILRSDSSWYWPSHTVDQMNDVARRILRPLVIGD